MFCVFEAQLRLRPTANCWHQI